ncbi:hypothetical protein BC332_20202 [Capsicum chinense]|nr:hypothetical protein BC332_20202 [Capsicum chinense]
MLDVGYIPKITDATIFTIISAAKANSDLSLRFCDTDAAIQILMDRPNHNNSQLQRLVLCNCRGLSADAMMLPLPHHAFRGLLWLCVGLYRIVDKRDNLYAISKALPRLVVCGVGSLL